jgi:uncharacterized protein (UPF0332 family)
MSIDASDLMALAQKLSTGAGECEWRAAASRAYYAAYHTALVVADKFLPIRVSDEGVHVRLEKRLIGSGIAGRSLAYQLRELKKTRTHADYRLETKFSQVDASDSIAQCQAFIPKAGVFQSRSKHVKPAPLTTN